MRVTKKFLPAALAALLPALLLPAGCRETRDEPIRFVEEKPEDPDKMFDGWVPKVQNDRVKRYEASNAPSRKRLPLETLMGEKLEFDPANTGGRVRMILFWTGVTQQSLDYLVFADNLERQYGQYGLQAITIVVSPSDPRAARMQGQPPPPSVAEFLTHLDIRCGCLVDRTGDALQQVGMESEIKEDWRAIPRILLFDAQGRLRMEQVGLRVVSVAHPPEDPRKTLESKKSGEAPREKNVYRPDGVAEDVPFEQSILKTIYQLLDELPQNKDRRRQEQKGTEQ
ncbi:MAG TPA: hypothetical protein PL033_10975 [Candidatus Brocadiia bacterium]|nr:hypothetical protein [Candidatus Brocadiia bacterium]